MAKSGWYVVKFRNEKNVIEVIPSNWIVNFEKCEWPTKFGSIKLQAAIKNRLIPSAIGWKSFPIKKVMLLSLKTHQQNVKKNQIINFNNSSNSDEEQSDVELPNFPVFTGEIFEQTRGNSADESNNEIRQIDLNNVSIELQCVDDE
ncbi:putative leucine-rich repeat-containing protein DDB G0290503 isoform X1, partial [Aphis craccivora]